MLLDFGKDLLKMISKDKTSKWIGTISKILKKKLNPIIKEWGGWKEWEEWGAWTWPK
jgi:hypothetical protein